jgi:hypothetical protein
MKFQCRISTYHLHLNESGFCLRQLFHHKRYYFKSEMNFKFNFLQKMRRAVECLTLLRSDSELTNEEKNLPRCVRMRAMKDKPGSLTVSAFLPAAILLSGSGWAGIWILMTRTKPELGPRWLFFVASVVAVTGTGMPLAALLNRRFSSPEAFTYSVVLRESIWLGVYAASLVWLSKGRVLSTGLALVIGLGFVVAEILLRVRSRSRWAPGGKD